MTRSARSKNSTTCATPPRSHSTWSAGARFLASIAIAVHVFAVFVAPWSAPPPSSQLAVRCADLVAPYLHAAFLNHGYRFFAPDPGPSHLVRYQLEMPDGATVEERFPDPERHWPRLWYHRHFMVSESVFNVTEPYIAVPPEGSSPEERDRFLRARESTDRFVASIARYLLRQQGAQRAKLFLQAHVIPAPWDVADGMRLDDESLYEERPLGEFEGTSN